MTSGSDRKQPKERNDETAKLTPSAAKLKRIIGPSPGCRMLTPYEIELLRESKRSPGDQEGFVAELSCHGGASRPLFRSNSPAGAEARMNGKRSTRVKSCKDPYRPSEGDGGNRSPTPSVVKLNRLIGPSPTPRMLTPYEIELLRKCAQETAEVVREVLAEKKDASQS